MRLDAERRPFRIGCRPPTADPPSDPPGAPSSEFEGVTEPTPWKISEIQFEGYEKVVRCRDEETGLHALIAVHDTTLGPALGGMRMLPYAGEDEALFDVLRLAPRA